jgi:Gram-negative bacterial TonB protein C-terminal
VPRPGGDLLYYTFNTMIVAQIAMVLMLAALGYQTPRLTAAMPIVDQHNTIIGNTVLATADVDKSGIIRNVRVLQGVTPFTEKAADAISQWKFDPARFNGHPVDSEISVIFMFRPPSFSNFGVGGPTLGFTRPDIPGGDHSALPITLFDPEWPVARVLNPGVVVFDLEINDDGLIHRMRLINDVPATAELARQTIRRGTSRQPSRTGRLCGPQ